MTHQDEVFTLLIEANPIPQIEDLDLVDDGARRYLATLEHRSSEVTQLDARPTEKTKEKPRRLILALGTVAAAILIGAVVILSQPGESTPAATQVSVVVSGTEEWTDTGVDLSIDDTVLIEADGAVTAKAGNDDEEAFYGPDGVPDRPSAREFNVEGLREANHASLIGRIGEAGAPFLVGSQLVSTADTNGRLFLGINDVDVENNAGEFTATITVNP